MQSIHLLEGKPFFSYFDYFLMSFILKQKSLDQSYEELVSAIKS